MSRAIALSLLAAVVSAGVYIEPFAAPLPSHQCFQAMNNGPAPVAAKLSIKNKAGDQVAYATGHLRPNVWNVLCQNVGTESGQFKGHIVTDDFEYEASTELVDHDLDLYVRIFMNQSTKLARVRYSEKHSTDETLSIYVFDRSNKDELLQNIQFNVPAGAGGTKDVMVLPAGKDVTVKAVAETRNYRSTTTFNHHGASQYYYIPSAASLSSSSEEPSMVKVEPSNADAEERF